MLIGGVAVVARGVARLTDDVDATVVGAELDLDAAITILSRHGIIPRIADATRFARQSQVLLLRHVPSDTPLDLSLAWLQFELDAIERAERLDLSGVDAPVATAEDLLVYKAIAWRPRDRDDIERLMAAGHSIDLVRVQATVEELAEALDEPERPLGLPSSLGGRGEVLGTAPHALSSRSSWVAARPRWKLSPAAPRRRGSAAGAGSGVALRGRPARPAGGGRGCGW
jgi:hypothetical protein